MTIILKAIKFRDTTIINELCSSLALLFSHGCFHGVSSEIICIKSLGSLLTDMTENSLPFLSE